MCRIGAAEGAAAPAIEGCGAAGSGLRARREQGDGRVSYSLGLQVREAAAGAAVARGPQIDLLVLPAEQGLQQAADTDASAALPWRGGPQPAGSGARLLAAPAAHDAAAVTERAIRSAVAVIVAAQPDDLVSKAFAHPTVWTAEQVAAAAAVAASTAPPRC